MIMAASKKITGHPTLIDTTINKLGEKYQIHDMSHWNHADRLRAFLNDVKRRIKKFDYSE